MQFEQVKSRLRVDPFVPVDIVLQSGERLRVNKTEHVVFLQNRIVVGYPSPPRDDFPEGVVMRGYEKVEKIEPIARRISRKSPSGGRKQ